MRPQLVGWTKNLTAVEWGSSFLDFGNFLGLSPQSLSCTPSASLTMSLEERFNETAEKVKTALTKRPTNEELLELYALFKQAAFGDNNTSKPGMMDLKGKYKWEAWNKKKGTSKEDAMKEYIKYVEHLVSCYS